MAAPLSPTEAIRAHACPLCGGPNDCAAALSGRLDVPCWCRSTTFSAELLARVPPDARGKACVCARCADAASSGGERR